VADTIFHEDAELKSAASRMGSIIQSMTGIQAAIEGIHSGTVITWQGKAADEDTENFKELNEMTKSYLTDAAETKTVLDQAVASYEKTERSQVAKVSQLDTKGVF
jgi:uncharacterized protein YukE